MELYTKFLLANILVYVTIELVWWFLMRPPASLASAMSMGFPADGYDVQYIKTLATELRHHLDQDQHTTYIYVAYIGTYIRRQYYEIFNGVFHMVSHEL